MKVTITIDHPALLRLALHEAEKSSVFDQEQIEWMRDIQREVARALHDPARDRSDDHPWAVTIGEEQ